MKPAVFFDRDGTLIKSVHYLSDPEKVELFDGTAQVLRELEQAGYLRIIVTNQAAINKGLLTETMLYEIQDRLDKLLSHEGASIDGWYFCPEVRITEDNETIDHHDRKPGPGMLEKAARDFDISLNDSWMVGDMLSDAAAGYNAGCKGTILVETEKNQLVHTTHPCVDFIVKNITDVTEIITNQNRLD